MENMEKTTTEILWEASLDELKIHEAAARREGDICLLAKIHTELERRDVGPFD